MLFHDLPRRGLPLAATVIALVMSLQQRAPAGSNPIACVGDCNGDGTVTIYEIITGVDIALLGTPSCPAFECNNRLSGVFVNCVILAANNALNGCPSRPPQTQGACCLGECPGTQCLPWTQQECCNYAETSEIALPISWCPPDQFDPTTGQCSGCTGACVGLGPAL